MVFASLKAKGAALCCLFVVDGGNYSRLKAWMEGSKPHRRNAFCNFNYERLHNPFNCLLHLNLSLSKFDQLHISKAQELHDPWGFTIEPKFKQLTNLGQIALKQRRAVTSSVANSD